MCSLMRTLANSNGILPTFDFIQSGSATRYDAPQCQPHVEVEEGGTLPEQTDGRQTNVRTRKDI